ncbi:hypothetical protein HOLleu_02106 [Holothuria leucospilota]|uniref:Uncharacterized protein n=1 Tax=Holothuria leucospilota TaxID=206669 RepID=A0A9Q1HL63_HOLLE|nr:hypothetical protein HOLleu_02106 [Holothuria leucospilota]
MKNDVTAEYVTILSSWADKPEVETDSLLENTYDWLKLQNRGSLFTVRNEVFSFFTSVEKVVRSTVHTSDIDLLQNLDIQTLLLKKMECEPDVLAKLTSVCGPLSKESSSKLHTEVLKCNIKMRCESFLKIYVFTKVKTC